MTDEQKSNSESLVGSSQRALTFCAQELVARGLRDLLARQGRADRLRADQGDADAQYNLGFLYENGQGVSQDYQQAAHWYRLAADQGHALAQCSLGFLYEYGQGVSQDYQQAAHWWRLAADQGEEDAQLHLGRLYYLGVGVPKDYVQAHMWCILAAAQGHPFAPRLRDLVEKNRTPSERAEAHRLARKWKPKSTATEGRPSPK